MRISDWSSDVCSSDLFHAGCRCFDGAIECEPGQRRGHGPERLLSMGEAAALRPLASGKPHGEWFGLAGIAVMALPTLLSLGRETWSTEAGSHGPIVLATGLWLFWRCWPALVGAGQQGNPMRYGLPFLALLPFCF